MPTLSTRIAVLERKADGLTEDINQLNLVIEAVLADDSLTYVCSHPSTTLRDLPVPKDAYLNLLEASKRLAQLKLADVNSKLERLSDLLEELK